MAALSVARVRRHLNVEVWLRAAVVPAWCAASAVAAWRLLAGFALVPVLAGLALGAVLATWLVFRRRAWSERQARVILDRAASAGGLALALHEAPSPEWQPVLEDRLACGRLPPRDVRRPLAVIAAAGCFVAIAFLVPAARRASAPIQQAALSRVEEASAVAEALEAEGALDEDLKKELERLELEAGQGQFDAVDWAALDAAKGALEAASEDRLADLAAAAAAAEKLGQALGTNADEEARLRAAEELEAALAQLSGAGAEGQASGEGQGQGQGQARPTNRAGAEALAKAMRQRQQALASGSGKLGSGQQSSGEHGTTITGPRTGEGQSGQTGSGGIDRGGGAAPVTFGDPHAVNPDRLPIIGLDSQDEGDQSELIGITASEPQQRDDPLAPSLGTAGQGPDGIKAREQPIAPRHRDVVQRYFEGRQGDHR